MSTPHDPGDPQHPPYTPPPPFIPPTYQPEPYQPGPYLPPSYQPPAYQPGPYPTPPQAPRHVASSGRLGWRGRERPVPRFTVALAGAGVALAIAGILMWGIDYLLDGFASTPMGFGGDGDARRLPGAVLAIVITVVGYVLVARSTGPLATAGVAASALGVPVAMSFLTVTPSQLSFSWDAVVWVSLIAWMASYLLLPRTRGHVFYLALSTWTLWLYIVDKIALSDLTSPSFGFDGVDVIASGPNIDLSLIGGISLVIGLLYYAATFALDRGGNAGAATGFVVSAFAATVNGVAALAVDLEQGGTGVVLLVLGVVLAALAGRSGRRFTTWIWSAAIVVGVGLIITNLSGDDHLSVAGAVLILAGVIVVAAAHVVSTASTEPDEV